METVNISRGINLHVIKTSKFKTITICLLIRRQLSRDEATLNALLSNVLRRGSEKYPTISQMNRELEDMYGAAFDAGVVKKGEEQILQLLIEYVNISGEKLTKRAIDFMNEVLMNPLTDGEGFIKEITESEIENLKNAIEGRINNKTEYAKLRCLEIMCENEPFGVSGDGYAEELKNIDNIKLYWHYKRILKESPIEFVVIGDVEPNELAGIIKETFEINTDRGNINKIPSAEPGDAPKESRLVTEEMNISQGKICIGLRSGIGGNQAEFYPLMVLNEIFGGSPNSKLFALIREKKSLCYSINSFVYRFKGILFIQCGADSDKLKKVLKISENELDCIKKGKIEEREFQSAVKSLTKKFRTLTDSPAGTLDFYLSQYLLGDKLTLNDFIEKLSNVKMENVIEVSESLKIDTVYMLVKQQ